MKFSASRPECARLLGEVSRLRDEFTISHYAGDHVLQQLARLLMHSARCSDVECRDGGEEFLLLTPGVSTDTARQRAELLCKDVRAMPLRRRGPRARAQ